MENVKSSFAALVVSLVLWSPFIISRVLASSSEHQEYIRPSWVLQDCRVNGARVFIREVSCGELWVISSEFGVASSFVPSGECK